MRKIKITPPNKNLIEITREIVKQNSEILEINSLLLQELLTDKSVVNLKVDMADHLKENKRCLIRTTDPLFADQLLEWATKEKARQDRLR